MTYPFTPMGTGGASASEKVDVRSLQGRALLVRLHDEVRNFVTDKCPDGWKLITQGPRTGQRVPNNVVRASVADVTAQNPDGSIGKVYPIVVIFTGTLVGDLKNEVGKTKLIMWQQDATPVDPYGNPLQTNRYRITDMSANQAAIDAARTFLAGNPGFMEIPAPPPYVPQAPPPPPQYQQQPQSWPQQQPQQQQAGYQPPVQQQWGQQQQSQGYPQSGYSVQSYMNQLPPQQQLAPQPQQQPSPWNTAAPPPGYQAPPQQQPAPQQQWQQQGPPQSFLAAAQGVPPQYQGQGPTVNHHGQPQPENPPY